LHWPAFKRVGSGPKRLSRFGVRQSLARLHLAGDAINGAVQAPIGESEDPSGSLSGTAEGNGHVVYARNLDWRVQQAGGTKALNFPIGEIENEAHRVWLGLPTVISRDRRAFTRQRQRPRLDRLRRR